MPILRACLMSDLDTIISQGSGHVYCMGIGGFGMAGLAVLLKARGFEVTGSDLVESRLTEWVRGHGIEVDHEHRPDHIDTNTRCVVRSSAVPEHHPVVQRARELTRPVFLRGETLAGLTRGVSTIAVAGTHGKTTTSAMIAQVLTTAGLEPGFCIGGEIDALDGVADAGAGRIMVVEADESDGTLVHYRPQHAVITNIEFDHMEYFDDEAAFLDCFRTFVEHTDGTLYYCGDDPHAESVCESHEASISYGFSEGNQFKAVIVDETFDSTIFELFCGARVGRVRLPVPGRHNVLNALAAMAVGFEHGLDANALRDGLEGFQPARRRFDTFLA
ncbi:MAG: Mur ligase family protein, partial [Verrucomicrobiota bacterium]